MGDKPIKQPGMKRISFEEFAEAYLEIKLPKYLPKTLKNINKYSGIDWISRGFNHRKPKHPKVVFSKLPEPWPGSCADFITIDDCLKEEKGE